MARPILRSLQAVVAAGSLLAVTLVAAEPLHDRVDKLVSESPIGLVAAPAPDGEFLRRLSLVLIGRIPSAAEARAFLDDKAADKRIKAIDRLLGSQAYVRHMTQTFDVMFSERRGDSEVKRGEWLVWLKSAIDSNRPWNEIAAEILGADAVDPKKRGPAKFLMDRGIEVNLMTREVGRMFFGMDLQCAQCHDHPLIDDYLQADYYGVYAFLNRTYLFKPDKKKPGVLAERPTGNVSFKSVFTGDAGVTRPRLPGDKQIDEPTFKKGEEYKVKPDKKKKTLRPIPKFSRREQLARLVREGKNRAFARNMANRLWAHVMSRGLVEPVDLHHSDNPPSHPVLLALLTDRFVEMKYDIRGFLRELVMTRTFARGANLPADLPARSGGSVALLEAARKRHAAAVVAVEATDKQIATVEVAEAAANKVATPIAAELKKADTAVAAAKKVAAPPAKALAEAQAKLTVRQKVSTPLIASAKGALAAAALLAGDKELASLAATLAGRGKKIAAEVAAMAKDVATKQKLATATGAKLTAAEKVASAIRVRHDAAKKTIQTVKDQLAGFRTTRQARNVQAKVAARREETLAALVAFGPQRKAADASRATLATASTALKPVQAEYDKANSQLATQQKELNAAGTQRQQTATALEATRQKVAKLPAVTEALGAAAAKAAEALKALGDDKELAGITKTLQGRSQGLTSELAEARKALPGRESAASVATQRQEKAKVAVTASTAALAGIDKRRAPLAASVATSRARAEADDGVLSETLGKLSTAWSEQFAIATIRPLSPEEMAWSVLEATGTISQQRTAVIAELDKKSPLKPEDKKDPAKLAARNKQIEQTVHDKLKGNVGNFVKLFAASAGQPQSDFFATVDQALFFANGGELRGWLTPGGGNLTDRLAKMTDDGKLVEELYLGVLTRRPTGEEVQEAIAYLKERTTKQRTVAIQEIAWALLTSAEFRFNH